MAAEEQKEVLPKQDMANTLPKLPPEGPSRPVLESEAPRPQDASNRVSEEAKIAQQVKEENFKKVSQEWVMRQSQFYDIYKWKDEYFKQILVCKDVYGAIEDNVLSRLGVLHTHCEALIKYLK